MRITGTMRRTVGAAAILGFATFLVAGCSDPSADDYGYEDDDEYYYYEEEEEDTGPDAVDVVIAVVGALSEDDEDGGPSRHRPRAKTARTDLVRAPASPDPDDRGFAEVRIVRGGSETLRVRVEGIAAGGQVEAFAADVAGTYRPFGSAVADERGRAEVIRYRGIPDGWDVVPFAAAAQWPLEVRNAAGAPILVGRIPAVGREARNRAAHASWRDGETGVRLEATLLKHGRAGRRQARVDVSGLEPGTGLRLLVEDASGEMAPEGEASVLADGTACLRFDSRRGDPLPGGVGDLTALAGRRIEVIVAGDTVLHGVFPAF